MNKVELVSSVAEKSGLSKRDCEAALNAMTDAMAAALRAGDKVQLVGFGSFEVRDRAARTAINPQTKAPVEIAAAKVPVFKAGKPLKDAIR